MSRAKLLIELVREKKAAEEKSAALAERVVEEEEKSRSAGKQRARLEGELIELQEALEKVPIWLFDHLLWGCRFKQVRRSKNV